MMSCFFFGKSIPNSCIATAADYVELLDAASPPLSPIFSPSLRSCDDFANIKVILKELVRGAKKIMIKRKQKIKMQNISKRKIDI